MAGQELTLTGIAVRLHNRAATFQSFAKSWDEKEQCYQRDECHCIAGAFIEGRDLLCDYLAQQIEKEAN